LPHSLEAPDSFRISATSSWVCVKNVRGVARNIFLRYNLLVCELSDKEEAL